MGVSQAKRKERRYSAVYLQTLGSWSKPWPWFCQEMSTFAVSFLRRTHPPRAQICLSSAREDIKTHIIAKHYQECDKKFFYNY